MNVIRKHVYGIVTQLQNTNPPHNKQYNIHQTENNDGTWNLYVTYGPIGAKKLQTRTYETNQRKTFVKATSARLYEEKLKKGYHQIN